MLLTRRSVRSFFPEDVILGSLRATRMASLSAVNLFMVILASATFKYNEKKRNIIWDIIFTTKE